MTLEQFSQSQQQLLSVCATDTWKPESKTLGIWGASISSSENCGIQWGSASAETWKQVEAFPKYKHDSVENQ